MLSSQSPPRWLIVLTIMLLAVIEILDMTIVNVGLPQMAGSLGASEDQISWVITSYIVSSAIFFLLTGNSTKLLGRKRLLLISTIGFALSSAACGLSANLTNIVIARTLQGIFGASFVPVAQAILLEVYGNEEKERAKGMAIFGMGIMTAPIVGPTLGGYIIDHFTWRWIFFINVPVCITGFFMALSFIKETPREKLHMDWPGLVLMVVGVSSLQLFLDRGNVSDWFSSMSIIILCITAIGTLSLFVIRSLAMNNPVLQLSILADRNYMICTVIITIYFGCMLGAITLGPLMVQGLFGYDAYTSGTLMLPRGIASALGMLLVAKTVKFVDSRIPLLLGLILSIIGNNMMLDASLTTDYHYFMLTNCLSGLGMGLTMVPLTTLAYLTLHKKYHAEASGFFSFSRNLGNSIGVAILITVVTREGQTNWNSLVGKINPYNPALYHWLTQNHLSIHSQVTANRLVSLLHQQTNFMGFLDAFDLVSLGCLIIIPLVFLIKIPKNEKLIT